MTGLSLPRGKNIYVRVRGYYAGSVVESVRNFYIHKPTLSPGILMLLLDDE